MLIDSLLLFTGKSGQGPAKQTIPTTINTTTGSTDYLDFGNATANLRNFGIGTPMYLVAINRSSADLASGSIQVALQSDTATNFATALKTHTISAVKATWKVGEAVVLPVPLEDLNRYVRAAAINGATVLGAAIDLVMFLTNSPQAWVDLPDGI
jgi:hypothetical protein